MLNKSARDGCFTLTLLTMHVPLEAGANSKQVALQNIKAGHQWCDWMWLADVLQCFLKEPSFTCNIGLTWRGLFLTPLMLCSLRDDFHEVPQVHVQGRNQIVDIHGKVRLLQRCKVAQETERVVGADTEEFFQQILSA